MPKTAPTSRKAPAAGPAGAGPAARTVGRPARAVGRERRQIVVDTSLLTAAMRLTGRGQSDTVNAALAQLTENAAIRAGVGALFGAFPAHPDHAPPGAEDRVVAGARASDER